MPDYYNYMDLYYIMEQLTSLDPDKVQTALEKHIEPAGKKDVSIYGRESRTLLV